MIKPEVTARKMEIARIGNLAMSGLFMALALMATSDNALAVPAHKAIVSQAANSAATSRSISLEQLGYKDGLHQEGAGGELDFYISVPRDAAMSNARINLKFDASPLLGPYSSLRVSVNGVPRQALSLAPSGNTAANRELSLPLTEQDVQKGVVEVALLTNFINSDERCIDERVNHGFFHLLPSSNLSYDVNLAQINSVRGFLDTLPTAVSIAVARPAVSAAQLQAAWTLAYELERNGHSITWLPLEQNSKANIVVGERSSVSQAVLPEQSLSLINAGTTSEQLAVTGQFSVGTLNQPWQNLLAANAYGPSTVGNPQPQGKFIPLNRLGMDGDGLRSFGGQAEWNLSFDADSLPTQTRPDALALNIVVPEAVSGNPFVLYSFVNGVMQHAVTLPERSGAQTVMLPIGESVAAGHYNVRLLLTRQSSVGDCKSALPTAHAQVLPSSTLHLVADTTPAEDFSQLGRSFVGTYNVALPKQALLDPLAWLPVLTRVSSELRLSPAKAELMIGAAIPKDKPFVSFEASLPEGFEAPIHFDHGRITVSESNGTPLLDTSKLPGIGVIALARSGEMRGLWIRSLDGDAMVLPANLNLTQGDVAFFDRTATILSINSSASDLTVVDYPDYRDWRDKLSAWRPWLIGIVWLVLTVVFVGLARRMRQRGKRDN